MSDWRLMPIASVATSVAGGPFGSSLGRKDYVPSGVPVIRGAQLGSGRFNLDDLVFVTASKADHHRGNLAYPGDVIVTQRGTLGQVGVIPGDSQYPRYLLSQSQMKVTVDPAIADADFLYYSLLEPGNRSKLVSQGMSAGVPHINLATLRELELAFPTINEQRRIARVFCAVDDLIENNRWRIELLEQMAQAIYREWFVHAPQIADGWNLSNLFDEADVGFGFPLKSKGFGQAGDWPVIRIRDIPLGETATYTDEFPGQRHIVENGDTLIGMDGEFHMSRWSGDTALLNQRVVRIRPKGILGAEALFRSLRTPIREWNDRIVGTTVAHLGKRHLETISLRIPPPETAGRINDVLEPLGDLMLRLRRENSSLSRLRDLLLPKLVTGEIDVSHLDLDELLEQTAA